MIKVMVIFGTRSEAIKIAPLVKELKCREEIECKYLPYSEEMNRQMVSCLADMNFATYRT